MTATGALHGSLKRLRTSASRSHCRLGTYGQVLGARMRRGVGPPAGAVLAVTVLLLATPSDLVEVDAGLLGYSNRLGDATFVIGLPVAAAFACWAGGADTRAGSRWLGDVAARRRLSTTVEAQLPILAWLLSAYLVAALTAALVPFRGWDPWLDTTSPPAALEAVISNAASLIAATCVGWAVGRAASARVVAPLTGLAVWWLCEGEIGSPWLESGKVFKVYAAPEVPWLDLIYGSPLPLWLPWAVTGVFIGLAAAAVLWSARHYVPACLLLILTIGLRVWLDALPGVDGNERAAPRPAALLCTGEKTKVCVGEEAGGSEEQARASVQTLVRRLEGVNGAPTHYVLTKGSTRITKEQLPLSYRLGGSWTLAAPLVTADFRSSQADLFSLIADRVSAEPASEQCSERHWTEVYTWLARPTLTTGPSRLDALSDRQRTEWLSRYFSGPGCPKLPPPSDRSGAADR